MSSDRALRTNGPASGARFGARRLASSDLWLSGDFLKLWTATGVSLVGSSFALLAVPLLAVLTLDASPRQVGILSALELMPYLVLGLFAGAWVDRLPRRPIMVTAHVGRALVLGTIPLAALAGVLTMPFLFVASFAFGVLTLFFDVAHQAYVPTLVTSARLVAANSRMQASRAAAEIAGPGLAGVVVQALTAPLAVAVNAAAFLGAAVCTASIHGDEDAPDGGRRLLVQEVRDGLAVVFGSPLLRSIAASAATLYFFVASIAALVVVYATRDLGLSPAEIGAAYSVGSAGTLAGAVANGPFAARAGPGRTMAVSAVVAGLSPLPLALATHNSAFALLILSQLLLGFGATVFGITQVSLRQALTEQRLQGRVNGTLRFLGVGSQALGALLAGFLGQLVGLRLTIALAAVGGPVAFLFIRFSPVHGLERMPDGRS